MLKNTSSMKINIICDFQQRPEYSKKFDIDEAAIYLSTDSRLGNVFLDSNAIATDLKCQLEPVSLDLCEIAGFVYLADKSIHRGEFDNWPRNMSFLIPVRHPAKWNSLKQLLRYTIATLTGDNVDFHFVTRVEEKHSSTPKISDHEQQAAYAPSDSVALFSGGLDSFAGTVYLLQQGRRPLLVSHHVNAVLKNLQSNLVREIEAKFAVGVERLQFRLTSRRLRDTRFAFKAKESSHRARSFMFMSFGAVAAAARGLSDIFICENGVLALNVPLSEARKGTRSTRHAHPLYLSYFNQLIDSLYGRSYSVQNPFLFWSKSKEVELLNKGGFRSSIKRTVSCWGYPNQTIQFKDSNHCGYCIPCIVRRVSVEANRLGKYDDHYHTNAFAPGAHDNGDRGRNISDLIFFCKFVASHSISEIIYRYPEFITIEAHRERDCPDKVATIIGVYKQFSKEVLALVR